MITTQANATQYRPPLPKNVLVLGGGKSGVAAERLLTEQFVPHEFLPDSRLLQPSAAEEYLKRFDTVIVSPGIAPQEPSVATAIRLGLNVVSELEYASTYLVCPMVAVTGTNGKTTTTALISHILRTAGNDTYTVGNIGVPLSTAVGQARRRSVAVVEASSYQLELCRMFRPHIAAVLNLTPDHLTRHGTMQNYRVAKQRVFQNMHASDRLLLNADDPTVSAMTAQADTYYFSTAKECRGAYVKNDFVYVLGAPILPVADLPILGAHNLSNALCACLAASLYGVPAVTVARAVTSFRGVAHRIQKVFTDARGRSYYDDSKATNPESTVAAIRSFHAPTVLILGGSSKGTPFDMVFSNLPAYIVKVVVCGETASELLNCARRYGVDRVVLASDFSEAVTLAVALCPDGGNVLLSPACASFDSFANYEQRGDRFAALVKEFARA